MTVRALLFDVDGTLSDTEEAHRQAFNASFAEMALPFAWSADEYELLLQVSGGKERLSHYFSRLDVPGEEKRRLDALVPALHRRKNELYAAIVAGGGARLRPGIARLLCEAEGAGLRLGIASTTSPANVTALLAATLGDDGPRLFSVVACGDAVAAKKPHPDVYRLALSSLELEAAAVIAFEDSEIGVRAAKAAELFTVATPTRWTQGDDFSAADLTLPHLGDVVFPLTGEPALRAGGSVLTLERLQALHARRLQQPPNPGPDQGRMA